MKTCPHDVNVCRLFVIAVVHVIQQDYQQVDWDGRDDNLYGNK